jgi:hypothetical protein
MNRDPKIQLLDPTKLFAKKPELATCCHICDRCSYADGEVVAKFNTHIICSYPFPMGDTCPNGSPSKHTEPVQDYY